MKILFVRLLNKIFPCRHKNKGWPITVKKAGQKNRTYRACLDCGAELPFDPATFYVEKMSA